MGSHSGIGKLGSAWIVGVLAYAVARALVVWPTLGEYNVSQLLDPRRRHRMAVRMARYGWFSQLE